MLQSAPLPVGEDSQDYAALAREIRKAVAPKIILDQMRVADILHFAWEEALLQTAGGFAACNAA
jgi:hypothetical protein